MKEIILQNPTVRELVDELLKLDQGRMIYIDDADTNWAVDIIHINEYMDKITMGGNYSEMNTYIKDCK